MNSTDNRQDHGRAATADGLGDVPAERPSSLDRLDVLVGQWDMEAAFEAGYFGPGSPPFTGRGGQTTFEWLQGRFFLTQRFVNEHPAAPSGIAIIGAASEPDTFTQHYYDSRGVARTYQMTLTGNLWQLLARGTRLLAALQRRDLSGRHHDHRSLGRLQGRAGVEA